MVNSTRRRTLGALVSLGCLGLVVVSAVACGGGAPTPEPELVIDMSVSVHRPVVEKQDHGSKNYVPITDITGIDPQTTIRTDTTGNADLVLTIKPRGLDPVFPNM